LKITIEELEFNSEYFYIQSESIVEKISFNNRIFYSKYKKVYSPLDANLLRQHKNNEITLALPLIENDHVNYLVIEYSQENWKSFYSLVKHLLKSLIIEDFISYRDEKKELLQIFINRKNTPLEIAYQEVENIKHLLELKSNKSYKILPSKNLPKNYNIITLPQEKI
jgi:signal peptidase I